MNYTKEQIREFKIILLKLDKKVELNLVGLDGNAFVLMGAFRRAARKQGWTKEEIDSVLWKCTQGDYDHLLTTLMNYTEPFDEY